MPQEQPRKSEGVQVRLDPELKREAKIYLALAGSTWQELLEKLVEEFVEKARTQYGDVGQRVRAKP